MVLISEKFNDALNKQIGEELNSAYIYLSMSIWLKEHSFNKLSSWYFAQYNEELSHAYKFMNYIIDVSGTAKIPAIPEPKSDWTSVKEIVETSYAHEQYITGKIHELVSLAAELKDYNPRELLQWFVTEQIEEEASTAELVERQAAFKNDMLFDQHTVRDEN
ncbi:MAG: ferritin [Candidatus Hodarchaeales archaeon]|jgi:ferritin